MKKCYKFKSMLDRDLYINIPASSHYRMVKPGMEFVFEGDWHTYWEDLIKQGYIALVEINDPYSLLTPNPTKPGKYRSIDDPGHYDD